MKNVSLTEIHKEHIATLRSLPALIDEEGLRIGEQYVMFFAEADLMRQHVQYLVSDILKPDVLEVGLGLGIFASQLAEVGVNSYTAVEPHDEVVQLVQKRVLFRFGGKASIIVEPWQLAALPFEAYDAIMYDTWPPEGYADKDFTSFIENVAIPCLRPGGRFSFFHSGNMLGEVRRKILELQFDNLELYDYSIPASEVPRSWTKPSANFLIPIATKGPV